MNSVKEVFLTNATPFFFFFLFKKCSIRFTPMFNDDLFLTRHGHFLTNWTQKKCIFRMRAVKRVGLQARKMVCVETLKNGKFAVSVPPEILATNRTHSPPRSSILEFSFQPRSKIFFRHRQSVAFVFPKRRTSLSVVIYFHGYTRTGKTADKQRSSNPHFNSPKNDKDKREKIVKRKDAPFRLDRIQPNEDYSTWILRHPLQRHPHWG